MAPSRKIRVAVLYGGRSGEHEVSLRSAASVLKHLDPAKFEVVPIGIDKQGKWHLNSLALLQNAGASLPVLASAPGAKDVPEVTLPPNPGQGALAVLSGGSASEARPQVDVVFPVMHGPLCEDGTIQGLFELADVPYVGSGVLGSAIGMDKDVAKRLARDAGIPIVPFITVRKGTWERDVAALVERTQRELGFPVFVKPCNMGSSVGVHKVKEAARLEAALRDAFQYDVKVLIERGIDAREIELSALENPVAGGAPLVSVPGEIAPAHEFYSYESKYIDENGAALMIPAKLDGQQAELAQRLAREVFQALECEGMARVDLFLDRKSGAFYLNEINTLPGFTSISMYPKMWEASGLPYRELLTKLVELALARHERKRKLAREYVAE
jgi:D-alanine-D-alanine ligase